MIATTSESDRPLGRLGHLMVAIAEPHRDTVAEYDRWFEAEHMYDAVLVGPGVYAANRYIAPRELKALRHPLDGGVFDDATKGSSLALYYLAPGTAEAHFDWSFPQNAWLGETGRNNADRTIVLTWLCDAAGVLVRPGHRVAPQIALDHPYPGLVMAWIERAESQSYDDLRRQLIEDYLASRSNGDAAIGQVQLWAPRDFPDTRGITTTPGTVRKNPAIDKQLLVLFFLTVDPARCWAAHFASMDRDLSQTIGARLRLVAPFMPTVRGAATLLDVQW